MKVYAQFLILDTNKKICDLLGSDGVFILDGRNKIETWIVDAKCQIKRLKNVQPDIVGYKIYLSRRFTSHVASCVHEWIDHDKIKFNEDYCRKIPLNEIDFIEMNYTLTKYQIHLLNPEDRSFKVIREYRGTKGIKFHKDHVEIR